MQNWKTQRPARNEMAQMFGEASALPCTLEEQVQIARLLTAYDRWLVCCCSIRPNTFSNHDLLAKDLTAGYSFGIASVLDQWQMAYVKHTVVWQLHLCLTCGHHYPALVIHQKLPEFCSQMLYL